MGIVVSVARMAGFYVFQNTYRPWNAQSYADFYKRCSYFFGRLFIELYYRQIAPFFFSSKHPLLRRVLPSLLAIMLGGWLQRVNVVAAIAKSQLYMLKYYFCLGIFFASSSFLPNFPIWKRAWPLRIAVYILGQGLVFILVFP